MCILTPGADANSDAVQTIDDFWKSLGMRTTRMSPDDHDRLVAQISHLPHAVASALISMQNERGFDLAGKGFLDTTRVASGDGALWRDILVDNQDNLRESIKHLVDQLNHLANMMTPENAEQLRAYLDAAAQKREALVKRKLNELTSE
jgi:prephenate dehydrogenase